MTNDLLPQHRAMLGASAIADDVAAARGYRSIQSKAELKRLGFSDGQLLVPTLLIPIYDVNGERALLHHRPDEPRIRKGKPAKYEFPAGGRMAVDVHPSLKVKVRDPRIPLFITEGVRKADAATSAGLCCVALPGVWNWRGTNEWGGKAALADWDGFAFKDGHDKPREVYVVYDSDVTLKPNVHLAMARLKAFLESRGARVALIYLPPQTDGGKTGLDDFLAAGHTTQDLLALATSDLRPLPRESTGDGSEPEISYRETAWGLVWDKQTRDGMVPTPLANFTARIVADVIEDDGVEERRFFDIAACRAGIAKRFRLSVATFMAMNWPAEGLGAGAFLYPGLSVRDNARVAIQMLSGDPPVQQVFAHTGWRELAPQQWVYLHAGGMIGADAGPGEAPPPAQPHPVAALVHLTGALEHFHLPDTPPAPAGAVRASLRLLELLPDAVAFPLLCAVYRAALGAADFSAFLVGPSGAFKSEIAALAQQHFGAGMDARHLPAAWTSTDNALEGMAFVAKDALLVIDDFAPSGSAVDVQRLHAKADRVLRAQGNNAARGRMNADGTLRAPKPPRGLILSTGEDVPQGVSLRGRMCILEIGPGAVSTDGLSACQSDAGAGLYAQAMSGFLAWLAPRYGGVRDGLRAEVVQYRAEAGASHLHRRTPEITANLLVGLSHFLRYASEASAITGQEEGALWERGWLALGAAAQAQQRHQAASEPTLRFLELVSAALVSGKAHVSDTDGTVPADGLRWGWRQVIVGTGEAARTEWREQGERIGWVDGDDLLLQPDAAYNVAKRMGGESGDGLTIGSKTLNKRLKERGLLVTTDEVRDRLTVRRMIAGTRQTVLHLRSECVSGEKPSQPSQSAHYAGDGPDLRGVSGEVGPVPWADSSAASAKPAHGTGPTPGAPHRDRNGQGPIGTVSPIQDVPPERQNAPGDSCAADILDYIAQSAPVKHAQILAEMRTRGHADRETRGVITRLQQQERRIENDIGAGGYVIAGG